MLFLSLVLLYHTDIQREPKEGALCLPYTWLQCRGDSNCLREQTYLDILHNEDTAVRRHTQRHNTHMAVCSLLLSAPLLTQGNA